MWSTLLFYPADVAKIRLQAEADAHNDETEEAGGSSPLAAASSEPPTAGSGGGEGEEKQKPKGGPKSFFGEVLVVLKRPDLWYAGLGASQPGLSRKEGRKGSVGFGLNLSTYPCASPGT